MTFYVLFFAVIVVIQLLITIRGKDAWPFSAYDMFSDPYDLGDINIYRVALEKRDGEIVWWRSRFYRYPEYIGRKLRQIHSLRNEDPKSAFVVALETKKHLLEVARLISIEQGDLDQYYSFHIVRRTAHTELGNDVSIHDETIAIIPIESIQTQAKG